MHPGPTSSNSSTIPPQFTFGSPIANRCLGPGLGSLPNPKRKGNSQLCTRMGRNPKETAHNPQGMSSIRSSSSSSQGSHTSELHSTHPSRRLQHSHNLEQRQQDPRYEQAHSTTTDGSQREGDPSQEHTHRRNEKRKSRLPEPPARRQKLQAQSTDLPTNVPNPSVHTNTGSICQSEEQTDQAILFLENRQGQQGQCLGSGLEQNQELAESTMGTHRQNITETHLGQGHCPLLPPNLENSNLVVSAPNTHENKAHTDLAPSTVPKPTRSEHACPSMGNPFCRSGRLSKAQLAQCIRKLESLHDIPITQRTKWLNDAKGTYPEHRQTILAGVKRLRATAKSARYPIFFDISPIINWAYPPANLPSPNIFLLPTSSLLDKLLIQLRLCTLMRASDISSVPWALFHMNNQGNWDPNQPLFLHTNSKSGTRKTYSIMGQTAITVIHYTWLHINVPGAFLIRNTDQPERPMGSERIAKRCLNIMKQLGIDTEVYKSHSLRGATATQLAKSGIRLPWIQGRGAGPTWTPCKNITTHCIKARTGNNC